MNAKRRLLTQAAFISLLSSRLYAGVDLPVETIKEMAEINPVNGTCTFEQVQVAEQEGEKSLNLTLKVGRRSLPASISLIKAASEWSESKGMDESGSPFWIFRLKGGDGSKPGAITDVNWKVNGAALRTQSLSLQYIESASGTPTSVTCM